MLGLAYFGEARVLKIRNQQTHPTLVHLLGLIITLCPLSLSISNLSYILLLHRTAAAVASDAVGGAAGGAGGVGGGGARRRTC